MSRKGKIITLDLGLSFFEGIDISTESIWVSHQSANLKACETEESSELFYLFIYQNICWIYVSSNTSGVDTKIFLKGPWMQFTGTVLA